MLEKLSDSELHQANIKVARTEREAAALMIIHLAEANKRHLYSKFDSASLHEYCTKHLKMSNGDAFLFGKSKKPEAHFRDRLKRKTKDLTEVTLYLDNEAMEALQRLKEIFSHAIPKGELSKIVKRIAKEAREKHEPLNKKAPAPGTKARIKYEVLKRDEAQCTYRDTNERKMREQALPRRRPHHSRSNGRGVHAGEHPPEMSHAQSATRD